MDKVIGKVGSAAKMFRIVVPGSVWQWVKWAIPGLLSFFVLRFFSEGMWWNFYIWLAWLIWASIGCSLWPMRGVVYRLYRWGQNWVNFKSFTDGYYFMQLRVTMWRAFFGTPAAPAGNDRKGRPKINYPKMGEWVTHELGYVTLVISPVLGTTVDHILAAESNIIQHVRFNLGPNATVAVQNLGATIRLHIRWSSGAVAGTPAELFVGQRWAQTALKIGMTNSAFDNTLPRVTVEPVKQGIDHGFHLTVYPVPGIDPARYLGYEGALRTVTGFPFSHEKTDGMTVTYTLSHTRHNPFPAIVKWKRPNDVDLMRIPIGIDEQGNEVTTPAYGEHTRLVATSGAGKGSVMWSLIGALAGRDDVRLIGVDFKGGKELYFGRHTFAGEIVTETDQFVMTIQSMYEDMKERQKVNAENGVRDFVPSAEQPLTMMVIDEAMEVEKALRGLDNESAHMLEHAMDAVLTQGRSEGFMIFAAMQYPQKKYFRWADRFVNTIALKLKDEDSQTSALGPGSIAKFGPMWEYDTKVTGTDRGRGAIDMGDGYVQFKAYYPDDDTIRSLPATVTSWESRY